MAGSKRRRTVPGFGEATMDPEQQDQQPQNQPLQQQRPPEQHHREKQDEKQQEKGQEKKPEKGRNLDEKYRRNPLGFVSWAVLIIWFGVTLLLQNLDVFSDDEQGWAVFFWGGAVIIFAEALLRLAVPRWRRSVIGSCIWGAIWAGVGFGLWFGNWEIIGPVVIIAIGVGVLVSRLAPRR